MQTPNTFALWLSDQARPLVLIALVLGLLVAVLWFSALRRRSAQSRVELGQDQDAFVAYLARYGFDAVIARTTYEYLQVRLRVSFPLSPGDLLREDLGLARAQLPEAIQDLMQLNGRLLQPAAAGATVLTVEDLIRLIQASPRLSGMAA